MAPRERLCAQVELLPIEPEGFCLRRIDPQRIPTSEDAEALTRHKLGFTQGRCELLLRGQPTMHPQQL